MTNYKIIGGDGRQYGPISAAELRQWIAEGRLNTQSLAQLEGEAEWKPLAAFAEIAGAFGLTAAAPPQIAAPVHPTEWSSQILAREPKIRLSECLGSGFSFFAANPGFVLGAVTLTWFVKGVMLFLPIIGGILHLLLAGVLTGGLYLATLRRMRGERASIGSIFDGFKLCFVQLMLAGAISGLLAQFGLVLCLLPGIYLFVAWIFTLPLVADKRLEFWSAMELSRKVVTRVWFPTFGLLLLVFLPFIAAQALAGINVGGFLLGTLRDVDFDLLVWLQSLSQHFGAMMKLSLVWLVAGQAGLLISQFIAVGALMRAYENLFGERPA